MFGFVDVNKTEIILAHVYNMKKCFLRFLIQVILHSSMKFNVLVAGRVLLFHFYYNFFFITASPM